VIHDVGYIESGHTSSLEMLTLSDELVAMAKFFAEGIPVNEQTLALDVIDRVANGPDNAIFLSDPHTFANFRTAHLMPELMNRARFDSWEKDGKTDLFTRSNEKAKALLASHEVKKTPVAEEALAAL
jgi:trimethylamine--corrinoid protein Co-methyltransferase